MKTHEQLMEELKQTDPESYNQIIEESNKEIEELRKWGGKRINAGRKRLAEKVAIHKRVNKNTVVLIKDYSKKHNISENEALDKLINAGYENLKQG